MSDVSDIVVGQMVGLAGMYAVVLLAAAAMQLVFWFVDRRRSARAALHTDAEEGGGD
jgi:hypothetical protein